MSRLRITDRPGYPHSAFDRYALHAIALLLLPACGLLVRDCVARAEESAAPTALATTTPVASLTPPSDAAGGRAGAADPLIDQLGLEVAIVAAHEGAFANLAETDLVWQVVEHRASTTRGRLAFLRAHSGRALGRKPARSTNSVWSVELLNAPDKPPASLNAAWWRAARAEQWELIRRRARGLVYGLRLERPCAGPPYTWGGAMDVDGAYRERGLVPLGCEGVLNDGFAFAPRAISAAIAKGGRR